MGGFVDSFNNAIKTITDSFSNSTKSDAWVLGKLFHLPEEEIHLKNEIYSKLFFSYRMNFEPIIDTNICSDIGWGCMHRSGQMILSQALVKLKVSDERLESLTQAQLHILLDFLEDNPLKRPYSIQHLAYKGQSYSKKPGEWDILVSKNEIFHVMVTENASIQFEDLFKSERAFSPIFLLIPVRLGIERMNGLYIPTLKRVLEKKYCSGIAGGKSNSSFYCLGYKDDMLICLDPHIVQDAFLNLNDSHTCHTQEYFLISIHDSDPSLLISFMFTSKEDLEDFYQSYLNTPKESRIFHIEHRSLTQKSIPNIQDASMSDFEVDE